MIKIDASAFAISLSHLLPILAIQSNVSTLHIFVAEPTSLSENDFIRTEISPSTFRTSEVEVIKMPGVRKQHPMPPTPLANNPANNPNFHSTNHMLSITSHS